MFRTVLKLLLTLTASASVTLAQAGEIQLQVNNPPPRGNLVALVFDDADSFGEFRDPYRRETFSVSEDEYRIDDLPSGNYAVVLFWDENNNGRLDRNFVGIPSEPIALTNNYRPMGPPSFQRARVSVTRGEQVAQSLTLSRPLGDLGQIGVGVGAIGQSSPYRGSNARPIQPIPVVVYMGDRLQWMGPLIRYTVASGDQWRLAAQGSLRLGAYEESDSLYLEGLGDRKITLMGGAAVIYELPVGLRLSAAAQTDLLDRHGGAVGSLDLSRGFQWGLWRLSPSVRMNWLSGALADYEFGVPEELARADRPAYSLSSALNWELGLTVFFELTPSWQLVGSFGLERLDNDIVASPIVDEKWLGKGFVSLTYSF